MGMSIFRPIERLLGRSTFVRLLLFLLLFIFASMAALYFFERNYNDAYASPWGALWAMVVFLASGFDYELPVTTGGRITAVLVVAGGVGLLGLFTATITTFLVDLHRRRRHGMMPVKSKNHFLVCGWNHKGVEVVEQLVSDVTGRDCEVVIVASLEQTPVEHERVHFVQGDPTDEAVLRKASVSEAATGIVLPVESEGDADGRSLLVTLALRACNPGLYICVEVLNPRHIVHIRRAGADEIISSTELAANMVTQAALNHGISGLYDQILSNRYGHEVYKVPVPAAVAGKPVREAKDILADEVPITLLAIARGDDLIVNPRRDLQIEASDKLLLLAERYPGHLF